MTDKEFKLSDERKLLRWQIDKRKEKEAMRLLLDAVEEQDKEFIRRLKDTLEFEQKKTFNKEPLVWAELQYLKNILNDLAGEELVR